MGGAMLLVMPFWATCLRFLENVRTEHPSNLFFMISSSSSVIGGSYRREYFWVNLLWSWFLCEWIAGFFGHNCKKDEGDSLSWYHRDSQKHHSVILYTPCRTLEKNGKSFQDTVDCRSSPFVSIHLAGWWSCSYFVLSCMFYLTWYDPNPTVTCFKVEVANQLELHTKNVTNTY